MHKKRYSNPKLYIPRVNGRPSVAAGKRWYVYFYWRSDPNGPLDTKFNFSKGINRYETVKERRTAGNGLADAYKAALERGWDPVTKTTSKKMARGKYISLEDAVKYAYEVKSKAISESTAENYLFHRDWFLKWAAEKSFSKLDVKKFTIDHFYEFMDYLRFEYVKKDGDSLSGTSVNNCKRCMSAFFTTLRNERMISTNFIKEIPNVDEAKVNNRAFTLEDVKKIKKELATSDPYLISFISFMLYPILRPREICRLRVQDINTDKWFLSVKTKTEQLSYRRVIDKLRPVLEEMDLKNHPPEYNLFSNLDKPKDWSDIKLKSRVDHFGRRFKKVTDKLGFGSEYGLYSFRHTAIMDLYNSLLSQGLGEHEIFHKLMPITQHRSVSGLKNYLRMHKTAMPPDHSDIYTLDF